MSTSAVPTTLKVLIAVLLFGAVFVVIGLLVFWFPGKETQAMIDAAESKEYLVKYGYIEDGTNATTKDVQNAMKVFQKIAGLGATGNVNAETLKKMKLPRCGMAYTNITTDYRWPKKNLTYTITNYPAYSNLTNEQVDQEIARAFEVWSNYTDLTFRAVTGSRRHDYRVDINIGFFVGSHGDGKRNQFDGVGGVLAHAFFPTNGRTHFDDQEKWTVFSEEGTNLFQVAVHEFGHALGLEHSEVKGSVMEPFYQGYDKEYKLHDDDIKQIQNLYGRNNICGDQKFDTIFTDLMNVTYVLMGSQYWELGDVGAPHDLQMKWAGLPAKVDAAFSHREIVRTYFFSGSSVWRYRGDRLDRGYPKPIAERFPGIPADVDAAFVWPLNNQIYFFKGSEFWKYDYSKWPPVAPEYPRSIDAFGRGIFEVLGHPDSAFTMGDRSFFVNGNNFIEFQAGDKENTLQSITRLFGCTETPEFSSTLNPTWRRNSSHYEQYKEESIVTPSHSDCRPSEESHCIIP